MSVADSGSVSGPWAPLTWRKNRKFEVNQDEQGDDIRVSSTGFKIWVGYNAVVEANVVEVDG